jgi:hypothetical protein
MISFWPTDNFALREPESDTSVPSVSIPPLYIVEVRVSPYISHAEERRCRRERRASMTFPEGNRKTRGWRDTPAFKGSGLVLGPVAVHFGERKAGHGPRQNRTIGQRVVR